jgi:hypothetical protein
MKKREYYFKDAVFAQRNPIKVWEPAARIRIWLGYCVHGVITECDFILQPEYGMFVYYPNSRCYWFSLAQQGSLREYNLIGNHIFYVLG